ncbi:hypothetical protein ACFVAV_33425 [Nocardia sp. NPDC057663]|uniref:hypothetical protein n=1 Tax=Nocardia sp. NPDC057663 TaxID=3346201 RepID=UPI00366DBF18
MTTYRALRALYWLHGHRDQPVPALPLEVVPKEDQRAVFDELVSQGAIHNTLTMGGGPDGSFDFYLTTEGRVQARIARDTYRHELAMRRVLERLDANVNPSSGVNGDFSGVLSPEELREATHYLVEIGLCKGSERADGEFYHVEITPKGRAAVRRPYLIDGGSAPIAPITNISADNYGTMTVGNQAVGGQGHTMNATVTQGASLDDVLTAISQLRHDIESAPGIDDVDREELLEEVDTLTAKGNKRGLGWLKAALLPFGVQVANVAGQELADRVLAIGSQII